MEGFSGKVDAGEGLAPKTETNSPIEPALEAKPVISEPKKEQEKEKKQPTKKEGPNAIIKIYETQYKKLLILPLIVILATVLILAHSKATTGEYYQKDISIEGGVTVTILQNYEDVAGLSKLLTGEMGTSVNVRRLTEAGASRGLIIDAGIEDDSEVERLIMLLENELGASSENFSVQVIGSALGASFFLAVIMSIAAAFVLMAIVVFIYFRLATGQWILIPSLFIIWTVLADMIGTFAVLSLLKVEVSTAGLAAVLLLIGFSVDTDILLTMRMLKGRETTIFARVMSAAKTGIFMTLAGMASITAGLLFTQSDVIRQIMLILLIGLAFDLVHTWITNTGVLRWYMERKTYGTK